ncbi:alpha-ketoglutarate-dependent dioxygenase AlkB family protein [Glaciecola punicea]|jgi:alkylated DNA repair dioxygenase AlkB|uniref:alpha-ketoglutarate-dependent dioxygenase AlkB family protein n=1 Tax=Glaciecola punicea TaxID=56804 RepID=UPI0009F3A320|nr:alpha-ketoglutarate-dependent dioxygenase AlkB [Glaciecola punicea]
MNKQKIPLINASDPSQEEAVFILAMENAHVEYYPNWLSHKHAKSLMDYFIAQLQWQQPSITLYGQQRLIPRLQAWYGDPDSQYEYSRLVMQPLPWDIRLAKLKQACEQKCRARFNSVLANYYRHGRDSMGMHADNEPELGAQPIIASVSLGQTRRFTFKNIHTKETYKIGLEHGSLLVMKGDTQQYWHHGMNKSRTQTGPRLNFTFRHVTQKK